MTNETQPEFEGFPSIKRLFRDCVITEKLDGTNAQIFIGEDGEIKAGSRNRWLTVGADNFGFAAWVEAHKEELLRLGPGRHFGEWWGQGIQRRYGLDEKRFSLFNVHRWCTANMAPEEKQCIAPACVGVVPLIYRGPFVTGTVEFVLENLKKLGSVAAPGFMDPEGVVVYHTHSGTLFKATLDGDGHKGAR
jgi:hypothetical protein